MTARSANGSCTPTAFSSGGSAKATGVIVTPVIRSASVLFKRRSCADGREPDREDAAELL